MYAAVPSTTPGSVGDGDVRSALSPAGRRPITRHLRQAEVEDLETLIAGDEDVLGFQIAVGDAFVVGGLKSTRDLKRILDRLAHADRSGLEPFAKGLAFEQLRHDERCTGTGSDVVDGKNVRVVQRRRGSRFLLEALQAVGVRRETRRQHLDRDIPPEPRIPRAEDLPHAACAEQGHNLVWSEARTWLERHGVGIIEDGGRGFVCHRPGVTACCGSLPAQREATAARSRRTGRRARRSRFWAPSVDFSCTPWVARVLRPGG